MPQECVVPVTLKLGDRQQQTQEQHTFKRSNPNLYFNPMAFQTNIQQQPFNQQIGQLYQPQQFQQFQQQPFPYLPQGTNGPGYFGFSGKDLLINCLPSDNSIRVKADLANTFALEQVPHAFLGKTTYAQILFYF